MSQDLPISRLMQAGILHCSPDTPLCDAARRMATRHCSSIVVMEDERAIGIWTEHDALMVDFSDIHAMRIPISEVMSHPVSTISAQASLGEAAMQLQTQGYRHLLVVDERGTGLGILSQTDIALNQGLEPYLRLREVHNAMRATPLVLSGNLLLGEAAKTMRRQRQDAAIILCGAGTDEQDVLGIITERDLVRFIAQHPGDTPMAELASQPLLTVQESDPLIHARDLLIDNRIRHLAVIGHDKRIAGLLGFREMLAGAEHLYLKDLRDALEQRDQALAQSRQNLQLAERVIDSSLEGIIITDAQTRIEFVNPAFTQMTGYTLEEIAGRKPTVLASGRQDEAFYHSMWEALKEHGYWRGEVWNRRKSGELYLELLTITAITDDQGETQHYAGLFTDITHMRENEEQIRHLAYYDPLTRLPNRRLLDDRISLAIRHAHRYAEQLAVVFIDLDHFKQVNDTLGHALGDELLLQVSERMREKLREDDTLARLGGDEFIALLPGITEFEEVALVAQRLIETVSAPFSIQNYDFRIGCSLGISLYPADGEHAESLVQCADAAMYRAKQEGRNTYRLYRPEMDIQARNHLSLETDLRNTVESGQGLEMVYQPLLSSQDGSLVSAEALLRWHHPTQGVISPANFIPLAERSGLIVPLGNHIIDLVFNQLQAWIAQGLDPVPIAINLSARQFWQEDLTEQIVTKLKAHDLPPHLVSFELTESTLLNKKAQGIEVLERLRDIGCHIAIDDFGTGYSSLSYLQDLPVNTLKIDRSFVKTLGGDKRGSSAIVAAVAGLGRELGLKVVAEGVETEQQWQLLGDHQVDLIQGFLHGKPVSADFFTQRWLSKRENTPSAALGCPPQPERMQQ
ncbi:EAL domain-containing protein [Halomonas sp. Bachu 37]|uniref:EAL domain-containing protein n=1 Tax=Halomonas kashgarensis TaxID=3084920 RepID=UPI003216C4F9